MSQHYMTLPSNTTDYSSNSTNRFRVKLPHAMDFDGSWEVALTDVQYTVSWNTVKVDEGVIWFTHIHNRHPIQLRVVVQSGFYSDVNELINAINYAVDKADEHVPTKLFMADLAVFKLAKLKKAVPTVYETFLNKGHTKQEIFSKPQLIPRVTGHVEGSQLRLLLDKVVRSDEVRKKTAKGNLLSNAFRLTYNPSNKRVELLIDQETINRVRFDEGLQFMLGFKKDRHLTEASIVADYNSDITAGLNSFYIYCDIVEPQCVGNSLQQLLRTVPLTDQKLGDIVHKEFIAPHYVGLLSKTFDTVEVEIKDDQGKLLDFQFGKIILKLHFRKKPLLLF